MLIGSALAAGVLSLPAHAQSYQDTALSASGVTDEMYAGTSLTAANDTTNHAIIDLTGGHVTTWSLHAAPAGVGVSTTTSGAATIGCNSSCVASTGSEVVADAADSNGNIQALEFTVVITTPASSPATIQITTGVTPTLVTVTGLGDTNNSDGTVTFNATSNDTNAFAFGESGLPTGLSSGNPLTFSNGTAAPNTYTGIVVTATDSDGAVLKGTFSLTVSANTVTTGAEGDYVNKFGNGFDSYRQHEYPGAVIAGWTATQHDPATHFLDNPGSHSGAIQIEYAPDGTATGLCVSDPGGGWASDPLPDGLILTNCNTGPFQQFIPQSDGTLKNLATGLLVNPNGKGAQLRGESSAVGWGGASYTWKAFASLPS